MADTPTIKYGLQEDAKRLYFSEPKAARKIPRTVKAGYGELAHGTVMAADTSAGTSGKLIPYNPTANTGAEYAPGRAYLVADTVKSSAAKVCYITLEDSYKFAVGDDVYLNDSTVTAQNMGAITAIDRTTYTHQAKITFTADVSTDFTTAKFANLYVEGGDVAVGILEKSVDTGTGEDAVGANAALILGNAVLYSGCVQTLDSAAKTDLSASEIGQYINIP